MYRSVLCTNMWGCFQILREKKLIQNKFSTVLEVHFFIVQFFFFFVNSGVVQKNKEKMKIRSFIGIKNNLFFKTNERFKIVNDLSQFIDQSDSYEQFLYRY